MAETGYERCSEITREDKKTNEILREVTHVNAR